MSDQQISQFTPGATPLATDYIAGYLGASAGIAGANRRWSFAQAGAYSLSLLSPAVGVTVAGATAAGATTSTTLTSFGYQALNASTSGANNTAFGNSALLLSTTAHDCTAVGWTAGGAGISQVFCSSFGSEALKVGTGDFNTAIGASAFKALTVGSSNTGLGVSAGILATTGSNNTFIGQSAGGQVTTGSQNTYLGYNAGQTSTGTANTVIGYNQGVPDPTASNQVNLAGIIKGSNATNLVVAQFMGGQIDATRTPVAAGAVTVTVQDYNVIVNKTTGAATVVNLPATPPTGTTFIIKDGKGDAGANNITITPAAGNIDGAGTLVINTNYGHAKIAYNGTQWFTV